MREPVLKAVAMPPKVFWAPMFPSIMNFSMQIGMMVIFVSAFDLNPIFFIASIGIVHVIIAAYSYQEPHLSNMLQASGPLSSPTKNVYYSKGHKLAP